MPGRLVNQLHLHWVHAATVHCDLRDGRIDLAKIRRRQLDVDRAEVLVQVIDVARTRDRNNPRLLRYQPCQCDLGGCCPLLRCELLRKSTIGWFAAKFSGLKRSNPDRRSVFGSNFV